MNELVSVVIPIYKVEKYLPRCIDSVLNQTYSNLEVILVDDGSPDGCPAICDDYARQDARIRVIHKENQGLGMARNTGIDHATGDYICFFDSDDYVDPQTVETALSAAKEHNADMVVFGYDTVSLDGVVLQSHMPCPPKSLFCGEEITNKLLPASLYANQKTNDDWKIPLSACTKLYAMSAIRAVRWRFASEREIISEDYYALTQLHGHLHRVCIINRVFYHYTVNTASLSHTYSADRFERIKSFDRAMRRLGAQMGLDEIIGKPICSVTFGFAIGAMKMLVESDLPFTARYSALKKIVTDTQLRKITETVLSDGSNWQKRSLCFAIKHKLICCCYLLVKLKNRQNG